MCVSRFPLSLKCFALFLSALATLPFVNTNAADGTWTLDGAGNWNTATTSPWSGGVVAEGANFTASFNTELTVSRVVTLTEDLTIGNLLFQDTTPTHDWTLAQSAAFVLTLQTTSGTPTITVNGGASRLATISANLGGNQGLTKTGTGTLVLSGNNTTTGGFTGTTTVSAGTLRIANSNAVGAVSIGSGAVLNVDASSVTLGSNISGSGSLTKTNSGSTLTLTGNGTHSGGTTLTAGNLAIGTGTNNGLGTGTLTLGGGSFSSTDNDSRTITNALSFGSASIRFGATEGAATGKGDLTFTDSVSRSLGGSSPTKNWTVNNSTTVTFNNPWTGNNGWNITKIGTGTLVFNGSIATANSVNVVVSAGTLILNGASNTYSGTTAVNGGTFLINGSKTGTGAVNVNSGGTLGGSGSIAGAMTLNAGGAIAPGNSIGTLSTGNSNVTWNGETAGSFAQMKFELGNIADLGVSATSDKLALGTGVLTEGSGTIFVFDFLGTGAVNNTYTLLTFNSTNFSVGDFTYTNLASGLSGDFILNSGNLQFQIVPEPSSFLMVLAAFGMMLWRQRRRSEI